MLLSAVARLHIFFFFQAEDGIRDRTVTGVQTCALPICLSIEQVPEWAAQSVVGEGLPQLLVLQGVHEVRHRAARALGEELESPPDRGPLRRRRSHALQVEQSLDPLLGPATVVTPFNGRQRSEGQA